MCGIAGVIGALDAPQSVGEAMASTLGHRGPDASGVWSITQSNGRNAGVLAHTRLRVIDLTQAAAQPFVSKDRNLALVFNGEIYNFKALRKELESRGYLFRTQSDTEVILAQYEVFGLVGLSALDGMFAFALWDGAKNCVYLFRDRLGKKPLYWTKLADGKLAFASEAKALRMVPGLNLEFEPAHLPEYLTYGYVSTPRSIFKNVYRLEPGHRLTFDDKGQITKAAYWQLEQVPATLSVDFEEAKSLVREAIGRAVEKRMVADVPIGAFLSGGIDSSVVVAEMSQRASGPVRTFSVGFDDDATFDETKYARQVAQQFGTIHTELRLRPNAEGLFEKLLYHHDEPYGDSSALAVYAISEATRKHVTVVLTGDGGDEAFGGYTRFRGGVVHSLVPRWVSSSLHKVLNLLPQPRGYKHPLSLAQRFVEHSKQSSDEQLLAWNSYFAGKHLSQILRPDVFGANFDPWSVMAPQLQMFESARDNGCDRLEQILYHNLATYLLDDLLVKTDRMTMAVALEARSPFLDSELIELVFRLPSFQKMRFGRLKWLLREAYRDVLGPEILDRKKHGFGVPVGRWWSGPLKDYIWEYLGSSARLLDYINKTSLKRLLNEHQDGRRDHSSRIFSLLQFELFLRANAR